ncbi:MAG TPA: Co2+/Mg2+ efflux protein ApaG [Flavobacteriales bacterium]|nr:Co2+/Mg2+ efflux protein ApaG [Flavobacteriales bacterium]HRO41017.1 Co2+/Mg2+ efflux protein ApaG [Flavobacteriales bacterium]HRP82978.1 Co2+/Mg2+ efflux protein ApaG [Flavobacteriales bacterium]HRQ84903.1 Co2+/Mg2+ efflux protein ApaG [Flavobacteriales bacterium]
MNPTAMHASIANAIRISAQPRYEADQSDPEAERFLFSYRITIANHSRHTIQLVSRHWVIMDSLAERREVRGPGVVGTHPVMGPGEQFTYTSYCELRSAMGRMQGTYLMRNLDDGTQFDVAIPAFQLHTPHVAN